MIKKLSAVALVTSLVSSAAVLTASPAVAAFPPSEWVRGPHAKVAMLVFDGQAKVKHFQEVLKALDEGNARASFFIAGRWVRYHSKKAREIRRAGHVLGNRGYGTRTFTSMDAGAIRNSIQRAAGALGKVGPSPAPLLRPPQGARDLRVLQAAGSTGYRSVRWTFHAAGGLARKVKQRVLRNLQWGSIIDLSPWRKSHRKALPGIIRGIKNRGYRLRTLSALENAKPVRWDMTLREGSRGPEVYHLQKWLQRATYPTQKPDGRFEYSTLQSVYAFEKVNKLARDGIVTPLQMEQILIEGKPRVPKRGKLKNYNDVDVGRQVVFEVRDGKLKHTSPMSSGNEEYYTVDGQTYKAHTPRGEFVIERKILGKRESRLGVLYDPSYFVGGYAFHGSPSVPTYPASHGCIRLPMYMSRAFFDRNPVGTPVYVHN